MFHCEIKTNIKTLFYKLFVKIVSDTSKSILTRFIIY